ncbi:MAG: EAL domain-containing protein [Hyphomicrobiaceae bacterium]
MSVGKGGNATAATIGRHGTTAWLLAVMLAWLAVASGWVGAAHALQPITLKADQDRLEITTLGEARESTGDTLQVETAPSLDGTTGRISVRAVTPGTNPRWLVFALHNPTDRTIEVWLTANRYEVVGSGIIWPDLDSRRIEQVTHSAGFAPERIRNDRIDVFRITIERGQIITYVAEITSERFPRVHLWKPVEFEQTQRERQLFNGIMLGITGLLAIFLTAVFAANHKSIFPSAALVGWCVLAVLCVDFGFWHKLFQMRPEDNAQYRAASEAAVAASLVLFLFSFLRVNLWHAFARMLFSVWIAGQLAIVALAVLDPRLAATVARMTLPLIGGLGGVIILFLALRGLDRALALLPTWILFIVWLFGAGLTMTGKLGGEVAISGLVSGLVFITLLIGFTVTQFAFRSNEPNYGSSPTEKQLRLAAIDRAGVAVFEWSARRDEIKLDAEVEAALGLSAGGLPSKLKDFMTLLHPADRERVRLALDGIKERGGGALRLDIRLRHADSSYRWFELEGASVATSDRKALRCVGLVRDVTDTKRAQERLLHDAVHDNLTGLPNRELFLDRLRASLDRSRGERSLRPTVMFFDLDKFKSVNSSFGLIVGDSILITISRRLARSLQPDDTLARIGGDQFALLLGGHRESREIANLAEAFRQALRAPIRIAGEEIVLTGSIGVAMAETVTTEARDLLREAEIAMHWAKRSGTDRIEVFKAEMRAEKDDRIAIESDLRRAIENRQLTILYQPIVALSSEELIGFEALVRWQHPKLGLLSPADFIPVAEETDLIVQLGSYVLGRAVTDIARWHKELPRPEQPLFVSVNISSRQLIKPDLVQEIRHAIGRAVIPAGSLRLEITESLVMENPEQATLILELLREAGIQIALDDFGTGYSSLAYLHRLPFDTIKIDQALVQSSSEGESNGIIVRSIVALAHELGKRIIAEGVETAEDAAFLRSVGCQYAQGFYYGEPMAESDIDRLLRLIRKADRRMRRRGLVRGQEKRKDKDEGAALPSAAPAPAPAVNQPPATPVPPMPMPQSAPPARDMRQAPAPPPQPTAATPGAPAPMSRPLSPPPAASNSGVIGAQPPRTAPGQPPAPPASDTRRSGPPMPPSQPVQPLPHQVNSGPHTPSTPRPAQNPGPPPAPRAQPNPQPPAMPSRGPLQADASRAPPPPPGSQPPGMPPPSDGVPGMPPDASSPPRAMAPRLRPPRKPNLDALSPAVAASLAKLAGGTARARAGQAAANPPAEPAPGDERPVQNPKSDAAE